MRVKMQNLLITPLVSGYWVAGLFSALVLLVGCTEGGASDQPYHHQVAAETLQLQDGYQVQRYFVGQVEARQRADLGFEVSGTLSSVLVDEGDAVIAGQLLATLDDSLLISEIGEIQAQGEEIRSRLSLSELNLQRLRELKSQGFVSEQSIDETTSEINSLKAQLKRQAALLASAQTRLAKHQLTAPYAGEVANRYVDGGGVAIAGMAVVQLLEQVGAEAKVGVPSRLMTALQPGDKVTVVIADDFLEASVLRLASNVNAVTRTSSVRLALPEDSVFIDGSMMYLSLPEAVSQSGYWVADTALSAGVRGMWNVYALVPVAQSSLYRIEARSIELLHIVEGRAFVQGALRDGEQIVATGLHRVAPGLQVRVTSLGVEENVKTTADKGANL
ncbi:MAG: RND family efflux transporter MFP subunit [Oceanicoccus sp.]|jgi:RND family efflux transporter MFP subunit